MTQRNGHATKPRRLPPTANRASAMQLPTDAECHARRPQGGGASVDPRFAASLEAEEALVGILITDPKAWEYVGDLAAEDFSHVQPRVVFTKLAKLHEEGTPLEARIIDAEMQGQRRHGVDLAYLGHLLDVSVCQSSHAPYFVDRIRRGANKRRLLEGLANAHREVEQDGDEERVKDALASLKDACAAAMQPRRKSLRVRALPEDEAAYTMAQPIIDGIARRGEVVNLIASPKQGKSFLVHGLAVAMATGQTWLGFPVTQGRVLLVDNELKLETLRNRLRYVATKMGAEQAAVNQNVELAPLRGLGFDLYSPKLEAEIVEAAQAGLNLIVLDALYKFLPEGCDENDNAAMGRLYAYIDRLAMLANATVVVVHHTSKGAQGARRTTDVGAGAGAISRATDAHLVIRDHSEPNAVVIEAVTRTFADPPATAWRRVFPLFEPATDLDPADLRDTGNKKNRTQELTKPIVPWTAERFVEECVGETQIGKEAMILRGKNQGLNRREVSAWITTAISENRLRKVAGLKSNEPQLFERVEVP